MTRRRHEPLQARGLHYPDLRALGKSGLVLERDDFSSIVIPLRLFV
jgi:hypothetical protein